MIQSNELFAHGGEMGARMRAVDWSKTSLGPVESWPLSLKTCVRIVLTSRQPMFVWWGDDLINLYNDAYIAILGGKHPEALGQPASFVWKEIWGQTGPRAQCAMRGNEGTYDEALLLIMERYGYQEETYYTFSYSPVPNDHGGTGGLLCANTDDTQRILGARQVTTLRELAARTVDARRKEDACARSAEVIATNARDLPFALVYLCDPKRHRVTLAGAAGIQPGAPAAPAEVALDGDAPWPFGEVLRTQALGVVTDLERTHPGLPTGAWNRPPAEAAVIPVAAPGAKGAAGVLIVGLSPYRKLDDGYRGFLELVSGQIAASVASAQAYEDEKQRVDALAALDRAKTAFFSNVSHEFRTPLTLMLGPTEEALASHEGLRGAELEMVHRNELRLLKLVNALLDFSRIEAGRVQASYEPTDLATLTTDLASAFRSAITRGGLAFDVDCPPLAGPVWVDRTMWEKIVLNLVSNAFKFTFEGTIAVGLRAAGDQVELSVRDTGVGIAEHELTRVFDRFHRIEGTRARTHEGSGIGLALVRDLVKLHGGDIKLSSAAGRGTTFTVSIPTGVRHLRAEQVRAAGTTPVDATRKETFVTEALRWLPDRSSVHPPPGAERRRAAPSTARILVVDDNADMRDYVTRLLRRHWTVVSAANGAEALEVARRDPPDLVLADVMMPVMDGFQLVHELRANPDTKAVPIIALSARAGEEATAEGLLMGADDYLVKPFSASALLVRVESQLASARVRGEARAALEQAKGEAEAASRAKDEFLAMLGHELRNPLAPILTALDLMRAPDAESEELARVVIQRQVGHLVRLVDDLLDVSRIARGQVELKREVVELAAVVTKAIEMASPLLEQFEHELTVNVARAGLAIDGDVIRLAQIVSNLLTNAAKYTPRGGAITIEAAREGACVVLSVVDTGVGIAEEMLPRVFDMFVQERQTIDRSQGGLGLGLAIVRNLVSAHGGTVAVRSEGRGRGSVFTVSLPAAPPSAPSDPDARPSQAPAVTPGALRILVVDDNEDAAAMLAIYLRKLGHVIRVVHDGPSALRAAVELVPDVALVDIGLPVMDGYELARRLRQEPGLERLRLVAVTGYGQDKDRERSREAGFDLHLVKPVDRARFKAALDDLAPGAVTPRGPG